MPKGLDWMVRSFSASAWRYRTPGHLATKLDWRNDTSPALDKIDEALLALMEPDSDHNGLAVFMPPQEGKSQKCSRRLPEWLLDHDPTLRIAIVSYELDTALRWGRDIKQDIGQHPCLNRAKNEPCDEDCGGLHITIRRDSMAAGRWETPSGGGVYCVGIGGPLTGRPVDVMIIDDPVKDRSTAESKAIRKATWDWWESVALTRLAPGAKVILVQTRWHEDDLAGRIFSRPGPIKWQQLIIPAIAEAGDPLGRAPGEELPSVRKREPGYFRRLKATMSSYVFAGVYQQTPTAPEGNFFRRATFRYWRGAAPWADGRERMDCEGKLVTMADTWRFITMDFAASTSDSADYTVASAWAVTLEGDLILLDRVRERVEDHAHFKLAEPLLDRWNIQQVYVESNWWSKTFVSDARDRGVPVAPMKADLDKVTRAIPAAGRVHSGRVWFPAEADWLDVWTNELATFPTATHDDQVDTLSYAARIVVNEWTPGTDLPRPGLAAHEMAAITSAAQAATGSARDDLDIMNVQY